MSKKDEKEKDSPKHQKNKNRGRPINKKRNSENNDSDIDNDSDLDDGQSYTDNINERELQKFIQRIFPSKNGKQRLKQLEAIDKMIENKSKQKERHMAEENFLEDVEDKKIKKVKNKKIKKSKTLDADKKISKSKKKSPKSKKKSQKSKKKSQKSKKTQKENNEDDSDTSSDWVPEEEEEESDSNYSFPENEDEELDDDEIQDLINQNMKFNIIFTVGDPKEKNEYWEDGDELCDEYYSDEGEETDDSASIGSAKEDDEAENNTTSLDEGDASEKIKTKFSKGEKIKLKLKDWDKLYPGKIKKINYKKKSISYNILLEDDEYEIIKNVNSRYIKKISSVKTDDTSKMLSELEQLIKIKSEDGNDAMMEKFEEMSIASKKIKDDEKKAKEEKEKKRNSVKFKKLLRKRNTINDFKYFTTLALSEQEKIISQLKEVIKYNNVDVPYKLSLLDSNIPVEYKANALKKINTLQYMDPGVGEYYKTKQWVDTFMRIPFEQYNKLPVSIEDGIEKVNGFMEDAKKKLDDCCFGLEDAKMQILQMLGQWVSNPDAVGNAIAIKGPPGTGKTTLVKEGVSKILNRPFAFIPLGGATDSSYLEGHSYTYEGSTWGKIVDILITYKSMNPVFYFDELDKVSQTPKGDEIIGILTHLTDTTQNDKFHDKYFSNIDFNLNKCLFIFSYNDESKINPVLKDRMYRIKTNGYKTNEKKIICKKYLIPKIEKNVNFEKDKIIIPDETIEYINNNYIEKEEGVRNLKRALEIIYTKINLHRLMKEGSTLFNKNEVIKIEYPFTVTKDIVDKLIKKNDDNTIPFGMYM